MMEYPAAARAERQYAVKYLRWLFHAGAAQEIGPDATALLAAVVTMEDEFFYQRPPNFFNPQLMSRCGMLSEHAFIRARTIAIGAGLLSYEPGAKRSPGRYFVLGYSAQNAEKARRKPGESQEKASPSIPIPIPEPKREGASTKFMPPAEAEVRAYWAEQSLSGDADAFRDYYQGNGWRVGKSPMKDWRATARNWSRRENEKPSNRKQITKSDKREIPPHILTKQKRQAEIAMEKQAS